MIISAWKIFILTIIVIILPILILISIILVLFLVILVMIWNQNLRKLNFCRNNLWGLFSHPSIFTYLIYLAFISLRCIIHFNLSPEQFISIHFLQSAFRFFFRLKFNKAKSFRSSCNRIYNNFRFKNWRINLLKSLEQERIIDCWI